MNEIEETFKSGLQHFGLGTPLAFPQFDRTDARSYVEHLLDWLEFRQICVSLAPKEEGLRRIIAGTHLGPVNTWSLNAAAFKYAKRRFIAINAGTFTRVGHIVSLVLSRPDLFSAIGETAVADESSGPTHAEYKSAARIPEECARGEFSQFLWDGPLDVDRWQWWWQATRDALEFVLFHELAHHAAGHLEYREKRRKAECLDELVPFDSEQAELSQAVEYDADRVALYFDIQDQLKNPKFLAARTTFTLRCRIWLTAVGLLLIQLRSAAATLDETSSHTHPHPLLRLIMLALMTKGHAQDAVSWGNDAAGEAWRQSIRDLVEIARVCDLPALAVLERFELHEWSSRVMELQEHHEGLLNELKSVRPW